MPWTGSGQYILPPAYTPEVNGTVIDAVRYNGTTSDIAQGITVAIAKNGQNVPTANLPMGGFRHTGVADAIAADEYATYGQLLALAAEEGFNIVEQGATGDNTTDDWAAIQATIALAVAAGGGDVYFPKPPVAYKVGSPIVLSAGVRLVGPGFAFGWLTTVQPVRVRYTGTGTCVNFTPGAAVQTGSAQIVGIIFDGVDSTGTCIGLHLNASAVGSSLLNILVQNASFINFPTNQVKLSNVVFNVTFKDCSFLNPSKTVTSHLVYGIDSTGNNISQVTFDNCYAVLYTPGFWCYEIEAQDARWIGGTIAPYSITAGGSSGVKVSGGMSLIGTHVENLPYAGTTGVGILYEGSNGAQIEPSFCSYFLTNIQIGTAGSATAARGWVVNGMSGHDQTAYPTHVDLLITNGGSRTGVIASLGFSGGTPVVTNNRFATDGVYEVLSLYNTEVSGLTIRAAPGTAALPGMSFTTGAARGFYDTGTQVGVGVGGASQALFTTTDLRLRSRVLPGTPAGGFQTSAGIYALAGVPSNADGGDGEFAFNSSGTVAAETIFYHKEGGAWVKPEPDSGWAADTGTDKKTANATYSGTASVGYVQAELQAVMDALRDATRTIKSLKASLVTKRIIGP